MNFLRMDARKGILLGLILLITLVMGCPEPGKPSSSGSDEWIFYFDPASYPDMETFSVSVIDASGITLLIFSSPIADLPDGQIDLDSTLIPQSDFSLRFDILGPDSVIYYSLTGEYSLSSDQIDLLLLEHKVRPLTISQTSGSPTTVTITTPTENAQIWYNLTGAPLIPGDTASSILYTQPFTLEQDASIQAIAIKTGVPNPSNLATAQITIDESKTAAPSFSPAPGVYNPSTTDSGSIEVTITGIGTVFYTTDGSVPTLESPVFMDPVSLSDDGTYNFSAIAMEEGKTPSDPVTAQYVLDSGSNEQVAAPTFSHTSDTYSDSVALEIFAESGATILYATGAEATIPTETYTDALIFEADGEYTVIAQAFQSGKMDSEISTVSFTIDSTSIPVPVISPDSGTFSSAQTITITGPTGSTLYYTLNGSATTLYEGPISLENNGSYNIVAWAVIGENQSANATALINIALPESSAMPEITPASGTYNSNQSVTITQSNGGTIYFTLNDSPETEYTAPIELTTNDTYIIEAYAVESGKEPSATVTNEIVIDKTIPQSAAPVITPQAGTYESSVEITITAVGTIYYTLNGDDPGTDSLEYNGPFTISGSGTKTVKAVALEPQKALSTIVGGTYVITSPQTGSLSLSITIDDPEDLNFVFNGLGTLSSETVVITSNIAGASSYEWLINGELVSTSSSVTIDPTTMDAGLYNLSLIVEVDGMPYSESQLFEVTDLALTAAPSLNPANGSFENEVLVTATVPEGTAYYTTDGSTPDTNDPEFPAGGVSFDTQGTHTINIRALAPGKAWSTEVLGSYEVTIPSQTEAPVLSATNGTFENEVTITATIIEGVAYYTTNGTTPDESDTIFPAGGLTFDTEGPHTLNVRAKATGKGWSDEVMGSYTVTVPVQGIVLHVEAASAPTIWIWEELGATDNPISGNRGLGWPGEAMSPSEHAGFYKYEIASSEFDQPSPYSLDMHFNGDGAVNYPVTIADGDEKYYYDGAWNDELPSEAPTISLSPSGGYFTGSQSVTATIGSTSALISTEYRIDSGSWQTLIGDTITVNQGAKTDGQTILLEVRATNSDGTTTESATYTIGEPTTASFHWDNASVYFVIVDRFLDGNSSNNNSYGRPTVDASGQNIGTFHGGDFAGLTQKLNEGYFNDLGVNAIWVTAPYEQIHGFVGGSGGSFAHYAYHGYYPLDFTNMDANLGTFNEFETFVDTAHENDIRVVMDIVMNHAGYQTVKDMDEFDFGGKGAGFDANWTTTSTSGWNDYHSTIDYNGQASEWLKWWGSDWIRAGLPGYTEGGGDDLTKNLAFLPDFKTESNNSVSLPTFLANKGTYNGDSGNRRVKEWLIMWLTQWVEDYGIDGFRVDTAKHVETYIWGELKDAASTALETWRNNNPSKPGADWTEPFWTTAEVWNHGANQSNYHTTGKFDSVINFGFKSQIGGMLGNAGSNVSTWSGYASNVNSSTSWNSLSYISSHDTGSVFYNGDDTRQMQAGTSLLLLPGGVQIFYGDELGRANGPGGSDPDQGSRSSIDWNKEGNSIHQHWQKVGQFRRDNIAVGAGSQSGISSSTGSAVARTWNNGGSESKVAIVVGASGTTSVVVSSLWNDGTTVRNAYTGETATVTGGSVSFTAGAVDGLILIDTNI